MTEQTIPIKLTEEYHLIRFTTKRGQTFFFVVDDEQSINDEKGRPEFNLFHANGNQVFCDYDWHPTKSNTITFEGKQRRLI